MSELSEVTFRRREFRGSRLRCLMATSLPHAQVVAWLNDLVGRHATIATDDRYMPAGLLAPAEAKLADAVGYLSESNRGELTRWWLAVPARANTPNWDLVSTCRIGDRAGLVLVEAKAHRAELHEGGKPAGNEDNDGRIRLAIDEAAQQLGPEAGWSLSAEHHYQLSNRFAWAWKLASLGVPTVLVYLGFLGAEEMPEPLRSPDDWQNCVLDHAEGIVPRNAWERPISVGSASMIPLIRSARISASVEFAAPKPEVQARAQSRVQSRPPVGPSAILCADWGKEPGKRAVYVADVTGRAVRRVASQGWTVARVLAEAKQWEAKGSVLVTFDAPLGVPASYLSAVASRPGWGASRNFLEFMKVACATPGFFAATSNADHWKVEQPFFGVPRGEDGLGGYLRAAGDSGVDLYRSIDRQTRAKTVFAKSGIPGTVGSAACALWTELGALLTADRAFRVWPFEGDLDTLLRTAPQAVGEIYPRAAYATALLDESAAGRPPLRLAKTDPKVRRSAIMALQNASWVQRHGVVLEDLDNARANEDDFDACITAAALLRCVLEGLPLSPAHLDAPAAEGGMLGTGSVNLALREKTWRPPSVGLPLPTRATQPQRMATAQESTASTSDRGQAPSGGPQSSEGRIYRCPIAGCDKTFLNSRGGWDAHIASFRTHRSWHPSLTSPEERKKRFKLEFPGFFV